jgi:hypothetical protein
MTERQSRGCDRCHTTVPSANYPVLCELPNGDKEYLCMHCKVGYRATEVSHDA